MIVLKKVLVATDFSPPSDALAYSARSRTFGASLRVLHVVENYFLGLTTAAPYMVQEARTRMLDDQLTDQDRLPGIGHRVFARTQSACPHATRRTADG
jgi:hypothetical protein